MTPVIPVSAFTDNYIWIIPLAGDPSRAAIVDPGDATPVIAALDRLRLEPAAILITHHHWDHCGGIPGLIAHHPVPVYGPARSRAAGIDHPLRDGDVVSLDAGTKFRVMDIPGHTIDHIAFVGPDSLFCGDTLFTAGCGRLFEGTPEQLLDSLRKLAALPRSMRVYCGHEYTLNNLAFAGWIDPGNAAIQERRRHAEKMRAGGEPTVPSTLGEELQTNPFLRCREPSIIRAAEHAAGRALPTEIEVFSVVRGLKDGFR